MLDQLTVSLAVWKSNDPKFRGLEGANPNLYTMVGYFIAGNILNPTISSYYWVHFLTCKILKIYCVYTSTISENSAFNPPTLTSTIRLFTVNDFTKVFGKRVIIIIIINIIFWSCSGLLSICFCFFFILFCLGFFSFFFLFLLLLLDRLAANILRYLSKLENIYDFGRQTRKINSRLKILSNDFLRPVSCIWVDRWRP